MTNFVLCVLFCCIKTYMPSFRYFYSQLSKGKVFELKKCTPRASLNYALHCDIWILPAQCDPPAVKYNFITTTTSLLFKSSFLFLCVLIEMTFIFPKMFSFNLRFSLKVNSPCFQNRLCRGKRENARRRRNASQQYLHKLFSMFKHTHC